MVETAHAATVRLLDAVHVEQVIVVGITGAIENKTPIGALIMRAISDPATDGSVDAEIVGLIHPDGRANISAVARYLVRHPGVLPRLARLARGCKVATERAADAAIGAIS